MKNTFGLMKLLQPGRSVRRQLHRSVTNTAAATSVHHLKLPLCASTLNNQFKDEIAFTDYRGNSFTFSELGGKVVTLRNELSKVAKERTRVSFLCPQDSSVPISLFGAWLGGHAGVPLSDKHPDHLLEYFIKASQSTVIVTTPEFADRLNPIAKALGSELVVIDFEALPADSLESVEKLLNPDLYDEQDALILFTSGTTGKPKGVLLTHNNLEAQVTNMVDAFELSSKDTMLHTLPLHHTHGLIHALLTPLSVGAKIRMLEKFDASVLWAELLSENRARPNLLMGVPTVYAKLIEEYDKTTGAGSQGQKEFVKMTCSQKMRLMLSGSASLPVPVLEKWEEISGHRILERAGMTEIGVAFSNPLRGERKPGFVGIPLSSVRIRVADLTSRTNYKIIADGSSEQTQVHVGGDERVMGDLLVKGPSVFKSYFNNPEATESEFTNDGWFITGDQVEYLEGSYKILGRKSVDIIKSGGYKLSALEIEAQLLSLKEVREVSVMALPDPTYGQKVAAIVVWEDAQEELTLEAFRDLAKTRLPKYACPSVLKSVKELPRNHLGKVNKKELVKIFNEEES